MDKLSQGIVEALDLIKNTESLCITASLYRLFASNALKGRLIAVIREVKPDRIGINNIKDPSFSEHEDEGIGKFLKSILGEIKQKVNLELYICPPFVLKHCIKNLKEGINNVHVCLPESSTGRTEMANIQLLKQTGCTFSFGYPAHHEERFSNPAIDIMTIITKSGLEVVDALSLKYEEMEPDEFKSRVHAKRLSLMCSWYARQSNNEFFDFLERCLTFDSIDITITSYENNLQLEACLFKYVLNLVKSGYEKEISIGTTTIAEDCSGVHFPTLFEFVKHAHNLQSLSFTNFFTSVDTSINILGLLTTTLNRKCRLRTLTIPVPLYKHCDGNLDADFELKEALLKFISTTTIRTLKLKLDTTNVEDQFENMILDAYKSNIHLIEFSIFPSWNKTLANGIREHRRLLETNERESAHNMMKTCVTTMLAIKKYKGHFIPKEMFQMLGHEMMNMWSSRLPQFENT